MIYLDNAATTQIDPRVKQAMDEWGNFANAGSIHSIGLSAKKEVDKARNSVAKMLNCEPEQIIFTSGGSESNATVMHGVTCLNKHSAIAYSATEHESVRLNAEMSSMKLKMMMPIKIPVSAGSGVVRVGAVDKVLLAHPEIKLVSVMASNNEICAINDIHEIAEHCHEDKVLFHTDCVQAVGTVDLDTQKLDCDFMSLSAHKFHGPKGVGVLYCKDRSTLIPLIAGSNSQEFGLRGGTENVPGIVGLGVAAEIAINERLTDLNHIMHIKSSFYTHLLRNLVAINGKEMLAKTHYNGFSPSDVGKIVSMTFDGVDAQSLVLLLSAKNVYISAGSACNAHSTESSKVLKAIGLDDEQAHNTVRFSFSKFNIEEETVKAAEIVAESVAQLMDC